MFHVSEVINNNKNRHLFRRISHESAGEGFNPQDGDRMFFGYNSVCGSKELVAVGSYCRADTSHLTPESTDFLSSYYNIITYIFVKSHAQQHGYGSRLLQFMEKDMIRRCHRNIHVQAARGAVQFFKKFGYSVVGEPIDCVCAGSSKFSTIFNMEKSVDS